MSIVRALLQENEKISETALWSAEEKAAARAVLRGVAARAGVYRDFISQLRGDPVAVASPQPVEQQKFGGFIRF